MKTGERIIRTLESIFFSEKADKISQIIGYALTGAVAALIIAGCINFA